MKKLLSVCLLFLISLSLFATSKISGIEGKYTYEGVYNVSLENNRIFIENSFGKTVGVGIYGEIQENKYLCKFSNFAFDLKGEKIINLFTNYYSIYKDIKTENYNSIVNELLKLGDHNILEYLTFTLTRDQNTGNLVIYTEGNESYPPFLVGILNVNTDSLRNKLSK